MDGALKQYHFEGRGLKRMVIASLALHIFFLAVIGLATRGEPQRVFFNPVYTVELVEIAPKAKKQRAKTTSKKVTPPPERPTPPKAQKKSAPEKIVVKSKEEPSDEAAIAESLSRIESRVKEREQEELIASSIKRIEESFSAKEEQEAEEAQSVKQGEIKMPTASSEHVDKRIFEIKFKRYYAEVRDKIRSNWIYPGETDKRLEAIYSLRISPNGELIKVWKEKGSGNTLFDESGLRAIKKSAPFPALPDEIKEDYFEFGVRFCPECMM